MASFVNAILEPAAMNPFLKPYVLIPGRGIVRRADNVADVARNKQMIAYLDGVGPKPDVSDVDDPSLAPKVVARASKKRPATPLTPPPLPAKKRKSVVKPASRPRRPAGLAARLDRPRSRGAAPAGKKWVEYRRADGKVVGYWRAIHNVRRARL